MDMSITLIMVMVIQVYTHVQTHQIAYINYVQFFVYQLYLNKAGGKVIDIYSNGECLAADVLINV